ERTGAVILAEGIETQDQLDMARSLGARLGQGWLFARPGEIDASAPAAVGTLPRTIPAASPGITPYEGVSGARRARRAPKRLLLAISHHLENEALPLADGAVVFGAFQEAERFTPQTHARYTRMAERAAFVAALGHGMDDAPAPGVRGAALAP